MIKMFPSEGANTNERGMVMLKGIEKLVGSWGDLKWGNHRMGRKDNLRYFYYHWTPICIANGYSNEFSIDNGGYGTSSISRAINDYRRHFLGLGYKEIARVQDLPDIDELKLIER